jgi:hypothetical protein
MSTYRNMTEFTVPTVNSVYIIVLVHLNGKRASPTIVRTKIYRGSALIAHMTFRYCYIFSSSNNPLQELYGSKFSWQKSLAKAHVDGRHFEKVHCENDTCVKNTFNFSSNQPNHAAGLLNLVRISLYWGSIKNIFPPISKVCWHFVFRRTPVAAKTITAKAATTSTPVQKYKW